MSRKRTHQRMHRDIAVDSDNESVSVASSDSGDEILMMVDGSDNDEEELFNEDSDDEFPLDSDDENDSIMGDGDDEEEKDGEEENNDADDHSSEDGDDSKSIDAFEFREEIGDGAGVGMGDHSSEDDEEEKLRLILEQQMGTATATATATAEKKGRELTQQELRTLEETENLFSSSLFRLAFAEVLREAGVNWDKQKGIEHALHALKKCLEQMQPEKEKNTGKMKKYSTIGELLRELPNKGPMTYEELHRMASNVVSAAEERMDMKEQKKKKKTKKKDTSLLNEEMLLEAPLQVSLVGSYLLRSVTKPNENVDVMVAMPIFNDEHPIKSLEEYYVKRAAYLCGVARVLRQHTMFSDIRFEPFREDMFKPVLVIRPKRDELLAPRFRKTKFVIRIIPALPQEMNISSETIQLHSRAKVGLHELHGVMEDQYFHHHLHILHNQMKTCPAMVESIVLLKVWARQRGILNRFDSVNGFLFSVLLLYLLRIGKLNRHMSPFQVIKITMFWIANAESLLQGVSLSTGPRRGATSVSEDTRAAIDEAKKHFEIVMLDDENRFNMFHRVSKMAWREVVHEAKLTLRYFDDDHRSEAIEALFLKKHNLYHKFDVCIRIDNISKVQKKGNDRGHPFISHKVSVSTRVTQLLERALADRIRYLRILPVRAENFSDSILVGIVFRDKWDHLMTRGPHAQDMAAKTEFEQFWGERSRIHTFKNGEIIVAATWEEPQTPRDTNRIAVIEQIVQFVLERHLGMKPCNSQIICRDLYSFLHISDSDMNQIRHALDQSLETVRRQLVAVSRGQLSIVKVQAASPEFSNTAIYPPVVYKLRSEMHTKYPFLLDSHTNPVHVIVEHESNSRWPDGMEAMDKLKQMFYMQYAQKMKSKTIATRHWLDVFVQGITFRVVIRLNKELQVMKRTGLALSGKLLEMEKQLFQRTTHCLWINSFSQRFQAYAGTVRLAKRWIHAHMFSDHVSDELIELICAHVFLSPHPYATPQSVVSGFSRFIDLLANFSWENTPMIIDFEIPAEDEDEDEESDDAVASNNKKKKKQTRRPQRKSAPRDKVLEAIEREYELMHDKPHIFVVASYNKDLRDYWTRHSPSRMILKRMASYASQTESQLRKMFANQIDLASQNCKSLFTTSFVSYDLIIHIKSSVIVHPERITHTIDSREQRDTKQEKPHQPMLPGFNPVENLHASLRNRFGRFGLFFMDRIAGGDRIAVAWNPTMFLPQPFSMARATATMPLENFRSRGDIGSTMTVPNIFEILNDMRSMGEGIIDRIEIVDHNRRMPQ